MSLLALAVAGRGLVNPDEPAVYADDEAFIRGRAAFETLRVYSGVPFRLESHLVRLAASCDALAAQCLCLSVVEIPTGALALDSLILSLSKDEQYARGSTSSPRAR